MVQKPNGFMLIGIEDERNSSPIHSMAGSVKHLLEHSNQEDVGVHVDVDQ